MSLLKRFTGLQGSRLYSTGASALYGSASSSNNDLNAKLLSLDIPTVELAYDVYNEKSSSVNPMPPILILHGLFGSRSNNRTIAKQLNEKLQRDVYCLDLRNHGDSPHIERHDYPALAADVERFIVDNGLGRSILMGHSMGAKTAMAVSLRRSDLMEMLISVDNSPVNVQPSSQFVKYVQILEKIVDNKDITSNRDADRYFAQFENDISVRQFLLQNIRKDRDDNILKSRVPLGIMKDCLVKGNIASWPFNSDLNRWVGPSLFIRGSKSDYVPDEYLPEIGKFFPGFEVKDIDAGHWVIAEKPKECLDVMVDFVERREDY
jgi:pimeloyl-ACP methyl ester carboxylesterase